MTDEAFRFSSDLVRPKFYRRWLPLPADHSSVSDAECIDALVKLWSDRYQHLHPDAKLVSTVSGGVTFLLDVHLPTASARTVAAVARVAAPGHAREKHYQAGLPLLQRIIADLGSVGVEGITTGTRRPPDGTLTNRQKSANQSPASIPAVVEQTIAHHKNWKVLGHYRGPLDHFERALNCVEALYNLEHSHRRHPAT